MADTSEERVEDIVARQALEIERMREAFALLGVNPCAWCNKYVRRSDPGAMFDAGELICYACIREWWPQRSRWQYRSPASRYPTPR